jgi:hypothetical protein
MATVYGVNATKNNAPNPQNIIDPSEQGGRVRWVHDSYEAVAVVKGSSVILGGVIPAGAQILPGSKVYHDALGSNSSLAVGTSILGVELSALEITTGAGTVELGADVDGFGTKLAANKNIWVTVTGTGAITGTIRLDLYYAMA